MTSTLAPEARRNVALYSGPQFAAVREPKKYQKQENGKTTLVLEGVPIFRSGVFRDSMGFQHTWEDAHMHQMVDNFDLLKSRGIFSDVPVRKGHGSFFGDPIDTLIGYVTGLRVETMTNPTDFTSYEYVIADYEIMDPEAIEKIDSGLWRNRSSEVGSFVTNAEAEYWPTMMGFAYVDIPAVEGLRLNGFSKFPEVGSKFSVMSENEKEAPVAGEDDKQGQGQNTTPPTTTNDVPPEGKGTAAVGAGGAGGSSPDTAEDEVKGGAPTPAQPAPVVPTAAHTVNVRVRPDAFRVNGQMVEDFAAVQRHIDSLELFQRETLEAGRKNFVSQLAKGNKIAATQVSGLEEFALGLTAGQYESWMKTWESAPALPLFGQHAGGTSNHDASGSTPTSERDAEISTLEGIVRQHKLSGMTTEQIEKTQSYQRLQQLKSTQS